MPAGNQNLLRNISASVSKRLKPFPCAFFVVFLTKDFRKIKYE